MREELRRYFWDVDAANLTWERDRAIIARRLLREGGWDATRWLLRRMTDDELRKILLEMEGKGLDPKRLRFWELVLDLPHDRVDAWVAAARRSPWYRRAIR